ncbi:hypothetical protein HX089_05305 [Myroides odoratimimus]|uniref:hypothetical protein n=1 Tax=Myroides odoratimimus TaxID=76832 RepID=UPI0025778E95|nr:hypothetical protein [Myroides odoratimimus]MDM1505381.1 hypothetical protein [Myroides odoratimimus]MDM1515808.1 hypothetical protein [Myroides odoratimimus]
MSEVNNQSQEFSLDTFKVSALKEVQNKREQQLKIVEDNPYIEIIDNETFTNAKKHRTTLVGARTSLEKEQKLVIKKIKENITVPITELYTEFIDITKPHEEKQQVEVKRWEDIKEQERLEKVRLEEERKQKHVNNIKEIVSTISEQIKNLDYTTSLTYQVKPILNGEEVSIESFEEYGTTLVSELESLKFSLSTRQSTLKEQEDLRLERERLENERLENERINNLKQTINSFYNGWINKIYTSTFESFQSIKKDFNEEPSINVQEFQSEYTAKRTELVKEFEQRESLLNSQEEQRILLEKQQQEAQAETKRLADENAKKQAELDANQKAEQERIQSENKRLEEEKQALQKEKDELLKSQRIQALKNLGFDDDLVLNLEHCKIVFPIEDILCAEEEFQDFLNNTKYKIENPPTQEEETPGWVKTAFPEDFTDHAPTLMDIESFDNDEIILVELNEQQKIMQTLLNDFCDYCLSKYGHIDQDYITEFLTRD